MTPHLDAFGLVVADLAASLDFYRRLGLDLPADAENQPHVEATLPGGVRLMWDTVDIARSMDPNWTPPTGASRVSLCFDCTDPAGVDRMYAELTAAGAACHVAPFDAPWGQRYATLHDPDGNEVGLFASAA